MTESRDELMIRALRAKRCGLMLGVICELEGLEKESRFPDGDSEVEEIPRIEFGIALRRLELRGDLLALQDPHRVSRENIEKFSDSIREERGVLAGRFPARFIKPGGGSGKLQRKLFVT